MNTRFAASLALLVLYGTAGCAANQSGATPTRWRVHTDFGRPGSQAVRVASARSDQPIAIDISGRPPGPVKSALLGAFIGAGAPIAFGIGAGIAAGPLAAIPIAAGALI